MRRSTQITLAAALLVGTFFTQSHHAFADNSATAYRQAMTSFAPDIAGWNDELNTLASATLAKPELACSADMQELAARGNWMAQDLDGTAATAPARMGPLHTELTDAVKAMTSAAKTACGDPIGAAQAVQSQHDRFQHALTRIEAYATNGFQIKK